MKLLNLFTDKSQENAEISGGRSMVEMLGVLAIIGVLSVGTIAGYSKAMMKYKLNKHAEQMNTVINAVSRHAFSFSSAFRNTTLTPYFIKMGEIPTEMIQNSASVYDVFGISWIIRNVYDVSSKEETMNLAFVFTDTSTLTKDAKYNFEICRNIITVAREHRHDIMYLSMRANFDMEDGKTEVIYGDAFCRSTNLCFKNITQEQIYDFCTGSIQKKRTEFKITFLINKWK